MKKYLSTSQVVNQPRSKRGRKKKAPFPPLVWLAIAIVIIGSFFLVLAWLGKPAEPEKLSKSEQAKQEFIHTLAPHAQVLQKKYDVLPSIILGQAILESDWGKSELAHTYKNLFGMKASEGDEKVYLQTKEFVDGKWIDIQAEFKVYPNWEASMDDHTRLFVEGVSWNKELYRAVREAKDYKVAAQALQDAGYATDPTYAAKVIELIETYQLAQFD